MQQLESALYRFCVRKVNLDPADTKTARSSRDWLVDRILELPDKDPLFPRLDSRYSRIHFGSFARRTKVRPLDDIDLMVVMYSQSSQGYKHWNTAEGIKVSVPPGSRYAHLLHPGTQYVNSRLVINQFKRSLKTISQYRAASLVRNQEAAVMQLQKHPWTYDIIPAFETEAEFHRSNRFLIPDGSGHWKFTDPRIDQKRATEINQRHGGGVLEMVRLVKYWNNQKQVPSMGSYLLETLVLNWYESQWPTMERKRHEDFASILTYLCTAIYYHVQDPKGIQGNVNTLTRDHRDRFHTRVYRDATLLQRALGEMRFGGTTGVMNAYLAVLGPAFKSLFGKWSQFTPNDQSSSQLDKAQMLNRFLLPTDQQTTKPIEPTVPHLHHPAAWRMTPW